MVDGVQIAKLYQGEKTNVRVAGGRHVFQVRCIITRSKPLAIEVHEEPIELTTFIPWTWLVTAWTMPFRALVCRRSSGAG
jgi:hypothetical protein